jgi:lipopolysaccharide export system protein LptA
MLPTRSRKSAAGILGAVLIGAPMAASLAQTTTPPAAASVTAPSAPAPKLAPSLAPAAAQAAASPPSVTPTPGTPASNSVENRDDLGQLPSAQDMRPTGPVTVTARHAELVQGNSAIYTGNVVLDSDTLKLDGDRLELHQDTDGQYTAKVTGMPGHMAHAGNGPDNPPVAARARTLNYDSRTGVIDLIGDALFRRGSDEITGDVIHYNVIERHVDASGGNGGQVKIVIQAPPPATPPGTGTPATPATAPGGTNAAPAPPGTPAPTGTVPAPNPSGASKSGAPPAPANPK